MPTPRDLQRLQGCHPVLVAKITTILNTLPMFVVIGVRTAQEQAVLYAQGRTAPGSIVTYKDGITHRSNHQPYPPDGFGRAVDLAWIMTPPFADWHPWEQYGAAVEAAGLVWGGRWKMVDRPHAELPSGMILA